MLSSDADGLTIGLQPARQESGALVKERAEGTVSKQDMAWAMRHIVDGKTLKGQVTGGCAQARRRCLCREKPIPTVPTSCARCRRSRAHGGHGSAYRACAGHGSGGFSYSVSQFNRATQAMRQPGSSFKPIVYSAALDNGYTPASVIMDAPITIKSGNTVWTPKNYGGRTAGPSTLRSGIEKSRNLMTVRLANDMA